MKSYFGSQRQPCLQTKFVCVHAVVFIYTPTPAYVTYLCHYTCRGIFRIIQIIADSRGGPLCTTFQRSPDTGFNTLLSRRCTDRSSKVSGQTIGIPQTPVLGPSPRPIAMLIGHRASKKTFLWVFVLPPRVPCKRPISPAPHRTIFLMLVFVSLNKKLIG